MAETSVKTAASLTRPIRSAMAAIAAIAWFALVLQLLLSRALIRAAGLLFAFLGVGTAVHRNLSLYRIARWPFIDDRDEGGAGFLAINNSMDEVCNGFPLSPQNGALGSTPQLASSNLHIGSGLH